LREHDAAFEFLPPWILAVFVSALVDGASGKEPAEYAQTKVIPFVPRAVTA